MNTPRYELTLDDGGYQVIKESTGYGNHFRIVPLQEMVNMANVLFEASCVADDGRALNMSNYDADDVEHLNDGMIEIHKLLHGDFTKEL